MRSVSPLRLISLGLMIGLASCLSLAGCADNDSSLFIKGVLVPEEGDGGGCRFTPEGDATLLLSGILDFSIRGTYAMPLLLGNQLIPRGDADKLRTETARIVIRGAVVTVLEAGSNEELDSFTTNASGFVDPASGSNPGWGLSIVHAIPSRLEERLALQLNESIELNIAVSVFGDTLGGDEVESSTITFPVFACRGCLVDCSTAGFDGTCSTVPESTDLEVHCYPGQDAPTPCQYSDDAAAICEVPS